MKIVPGLPDWWNDVPECHWLPLPSAVLDNGDGTASLSGAIKSVFRRFGPPDSIEIALEISAKWSCVFRYVASDHPDYPIYGPMSPLSFARMWTEPPRTVDAISRALLQLNLSVAGDQQPFAYDHVGQYPAHLWFERDRFCTQLVDRRFAHRSVRYPAALVSP